MSEKFLEECLGRCALELLESCSVAAEIVDNKVTREVHADDTAAFIGFVAPELRGTLLMIAPRPLIEATHPMKLGGPALRNHALFDWWAEMANQLLGRVKNRLGIEMHVTPPRAIAGEQLHTPSVPGRTVCALHLDAKYGRLGVWFDVIASESVTFPGEVAEQSDTAVEGEMLLF